MDDSGGYTHVFRAGNPLRTVRTTLDHLDLEFQNGRHLRIILNLGLWDSLIHELILSIPMFSGSRNSIGTVLMTLDLWIVRGSPLEFKNGHHSTSFFCLCLWNSWARNPNRTEVINFDQLVMAAIFNSKMATNQDHFTQIKSQKLMDGMLQNLSKNHGVNFRLGLI